MPSELFDAMVVLNVPTLGPLPFLICAIVPAGADEQKRAEACARICLAALLGPGIGAG